ncbi:response regulator transcription factor [Dactylosporangium matsuzakiense]|uniref:DNA-binding response regulator n=1 Tax=Dactylosporangium matsuzakiense TaxID=53360 RepID=A0A9W6NP89_9ACTN|nr:response regulator transcription factor [Dactylosporangium matsuzakiense]GLL03852.1 DNA-binding response regulator [Dactylosporangium matsuzakiense]
MSIRVVVADDQTAVREGLALMLSLLDDVEVVGEAADGEAALELVAAHRPDVVLMDLRMPRRDGVSATAEMTTFADDEHILSALQAGALGYLTKDAGRVQIAHAVRAAAAGQSVLDPQVQQRLVAAAVQGGGSATTAEAPAAAEGLTARETEVLALIAAGLSNREIAERLYVTEVTVKSHINRLFAKIGVRDRAQAVRYAYERGIRP